MQMDVRLKSNLTTDEESETNQKVFELKKINFVFIKNHV